MNMPTFETHDGFVKAIRMDCVNQPVLLVDIAYARDNDAGLIVHMGIEEFLALKRIICVGDEVQISKMRGGAMAIASAPVISITKAGPSEPGSSAGVWIWLAALELSLRRKLTETNGLGINNEQQVKWTTQFGRLLDWQLANGVTSLFSRLEPGELNSYDQLYYAEKTDVGHRAWDRQGETYKLAQAKVRHTGVYFPHYSSTSGFWPVLEKR